MSKHTPGPWKLCSNEQDKNFQIIGADSLPVTTIATTISSNSAKWSNKKLRPKELWASVANDTEQANARLIAAAPELLAACLEVAQGYTTRGSEMARAAIEKATGGSL